MDQIVERPRRRDAGKDEPIAKVLGLGADGKPAPRRSKSLLALSALAVLGMAGAYAYVSLAGQPAPVVYATAPAERGALTVEVSATGTLQPLTQVEISSELSGVVRQVFVGENERVAAGDLLAELDTTRIEAQIERAEANVAASAARVSDADVTLAETESALRRARELSGRGMVADQTLETALAARDRAESAVEIARANLAIAEAELKLQQADLEKSYILSPIDGMVLTRSVNPGQTVASSMSAPVLFLIAENLETMELKAAIDEADIGSVAAGQTARFTVDAFSGRAFDAQIRDISFASVETDGVVTYEARLNVANQDLLLRPGMTASVDIVTREAQDALLVPAAAFRFSPPEEAETRGFSIQSMFMPARPRMGQRGGGQRMRGGADAGRPLYVLRGGEPEMVRVETGASDGAVMEILSGLSEGDEVVLSVRQAR